MDTRKIPSDKNTMSTKKKRIIITLQQKFDMIEQHERGHGNSKLGQYVGKPKSMVRNTIKHTGEIEENGKVASAFCG
jgi:hypothetical protein